MSNQEWRNHEEDVHLYLGFLRKKLNGEDCRPRCIRRIAKSEQDLDILKRELEVIGGHWRVHRTVNRRSTKKAFKTFQHYLVDNPDCAPYLDSVWKTILLQSESKAERFYMIDVDSKDDVKMTIIKEMLGCLFVAKHETPNGFHILTKPFDVRMAKDVSDITILKDGYVYICSVGDK